MVGLKQTSGQEILENEIIADYQLGWLSRYTSLIGRREVLSGRAKFGIFGAGKELAQLALAKVYQPGDFRSGYYRDQTLMFAIGQLTVQQFFAQLYADADLTNEPSSGGRQMNAHFSTRSLDEKGRWLELMEIKNSSADVSPTASQMPRLVGLAYASKLYREIPALEAFSQFSDGGNEIAFGTIGNASAAEGMFWESLNAISVLQSPAIISVWDDDYGISVSNQYQFGKDLSDLLRGFSRRGGEEYGYQFYRVAGWDYQAMIDVYREAETYARNDHIPSIVHVVELTQPQGHSTSGSHERYKSPERLDWESEHDCLHQFRQWILENGLAEEDVLSEIEENARRQVEEDREEAWNAYKRPIRESMQDVTEIFDAAMVNLNQRRELQEITSSLKMKTNPLRKDLVESISIFLLKTRADNYPEKTQLLQLKQEMEKAGNRLYGSHLTSETEENTFKTVEVGPVYSDDSPMLNGFEIINRAFDAILSRDSRVIAFGEDLGKIGGVNQGFAELQEKYGQFRVSDTGIRETTIIGQAIGMAMRGLRPIAEIQYLDYLLYAMQIISDDLATVHWRTVGRQKAPVVIRTRGHRLEGVWHSGSLMAGIIHLARGLNVIVPRNMVQAAGFYNTLLKSDEPGLVVEVLNGYRLKERLPDNIGEMTLPLGQPEVIRQGEDVTIVTYGPLCRISMEAAERLQDVGISTEIIDVRTLLPFDLDGQILESLKKTNRIVFLDEDVPGGATAYMLQEVIEKQGGYYWLDAEPRTLSSKPHRPAYGSDGNYFSKPNVETIFETVYELMHEAAPGRFPVYYQ